MTKPEEATEKDREMTNTDEKDKEFRDRCDVMWDGNGHIIFDGLECDLDHLVNQCIAYGRRTAPRDGVDREMLLKAVRYYQRYKTCEEVNKVPYSNRLLTDEVVDQFLASQAKGEK